MIAVLVRIDALELMHARKRKSICTRSGGPATTIATKKTDDQNEFMTLVQARTGGVLWANAYLVA